MMVEVKMLTKISPQEQVVMFTAAFYLEQIHYEVQAIFSIIWMQAQVLLTGLEFFLELIQITQMH